ncbi:IS256 family transposase, variant Zn-binding type, partial [Actinobacillus pleuropneumoniae]|uniref:IS256 family transposase, variant Zn-binding type n=1 Tax=Actinobacillus pleuropneumoniae TaxID=715 RepID=UPI003B01D96B
MKTCPFCQSSKTQKHGFKNKLQRYKCSACNKIFTLTSKLNSTQIWLDYSVGKQTYQQLANKYQCSVRTIQRYLEKAPKAFLKAPQNKYLNLIIDTTFFHRDFGVMVFIDSLSTKVVYHQIVKTEKDIYYKKAINHLREKGYIIQSITCDGRRGLLKDLMNTPTQMCQFHLVAIVMRALRKKHQSHAGRKLKTIIKTLKVSSKNEFYLKIHHWKIKHKAFLEERSDKPNEKGKYPYKHRNVRSAYTSIKRYMDYIFTYEKYPELNIEKTTNRIEGLFKELKDKLRPHSGLTRKHKILFIQDFLNKKSR